MKKRGKNLDTAFKDFWQPLVIGSFSHRIRTMPLYDLEIQDAIKKTAKYAFWQGWQARAKRDAVVKRKKK